MFLGERSINADHCHHSAKGRNFHPTWQVSFWAYHLTSAVGGNIAAAARAKGSTGKNAEVLRGIKMSIATCGHSLYTASLCIYN